MAKTLKFFAWPDRARWLWYKCSSEGPLGGTRNGKVFGFEGPVAYSRTERCMSARMIWAQLSASKVHWFEGRKPWTEPSFEFRACSDHVPRDPITPLRLPEAFQRTSAVAAWASFRPRPPNASWSRLMPIRGVHAGVELGAHNWYCSVQAKTLIGRSRKYMLPLFGHPDESPNSMPLAIVWNGFEWAEYRGSSTSVGKEIEFADKMPSWRRRPLGSIGTQGQRSY